MEFPSFAFLLAFLMKELLLIQMASNCKYDDEFWEIRTDCQKQNGMYNFDANILNNSTEREKEVYFKLYELATYCVIMRMNWSDANYIARTDQTLTSLQTHIIADDATKMKIDKNGRDCFDIYSYERADTNKLMKCLSAGVKDACAGEPG